MRPEAKVGLIIVAAILTLLVVYWFLGGLALTATSFTVFAEFRDVHILTAGSAVRMAGVRIGVVDEIILTEESLARVRMRIQRRYGVPVNSTAVVTTGGLIGEPYVEITPGAGPEMHQSGDTIASRDLVRLDELLQQVSDIMVDLRGATSGIRQIFEDPEMIAAVRNTMRDLQSASESVAAAAGAVRGIAEESRPEIASILNNVDVAARQAAQLANRLDRTIGQVDMQQVQAILTNAQVASARLASAAAGLEDLTTDPAIAEDVRATVASARESAEGVARMLGRLERFTERVGDRETPRIPVPQPIRREGLTLDVLAGTGDEDLRVDLNYDFRLPGLLGLRADPNQFYSVGLFDVADNARLNLQQGRVLDNGSAFRYGLYASRLGIGFDWRLAANPSLRADLFGLRDPRLDVRALYDVSPRWGLWLGLSDLLDEQDVTVGTRFKW